MSYNRGTYGSRVLSGLINSYTAPTHARGVVSAVAKKYGLTVNDLKPLRGCGKPHPYDQIIIEAIRACAEHQFPNWQIAEALGRHEQRIYQIRAKHNIPGPKSAHRRDK